MMEFGKRLSWRLTGGVAAVAIGALAAAQAQRQELPQDAETPPLHQSAPVNSTLQPIAADDGPSAPIQPAAFVATMPLTEKSNESGPSFRPNIGAAPPTGSISQVSHEEPIDEPDGHDGPAAHDGPMSMPPAAFSPTGMMGLPSEMPGERMDAPSQGGPAAQSEVNAGPAMAMSFMGLPHEQESPQDELEQAGPSPVNPSAGPDPVVPTTPDPEMPESAPMPEIQFDQGPMMMVSPPPGEAGPALSAPPSSQPQAMMGGGPANYEPESMGESAPSMYGAAPLHESASEAEPESMYGAAPPMYESAPARGQAPAMQGFASEQPDVPGETFGGGSLQQPAAMENQLRSAPVAESHEPNMSSQSPLPELPQPTLYQNSASGLGMQQNEPAMQPTPAQYAGHQRESNPGIAMPGQRLPESGMTQDAYLASGNEPISINLPGDRRLEGAQSPSVVIHKRAPEEVKVGQPATFVIQVRNAGTTEALGVLVHDRVPAGMQLVDATPTPIMQGDMLVWQLGAMPAGDERSITLQLVAQEEGELGSVARVTFEAAASVRTRSTRPELKITQKAPAKVLIGQQLEIELEVANVGTGAATGVVLQADVPPGLDHPNGRQLDNALGTLRPGEVRREVLRMRAVEPGMVENVVHLTSADAKPTKHSVSVEVVAPKLNIAISGPSRRFLERQATYNVKIENPGTAAARNVEVLARLDRGFTFVSTENNGQYDPNRHAVRWSIVELPAGESASVPVTLLPIEAGDQVIRMEAMADLDTRSESEHTVAVESQAELTFSIADTADPIELGSETTYEIKVRNAGSRNDTNVQVRLLLPPGIEMLESDSDAGTDGRGGVVFAPHANLPAGGDLTYRIRVRGIQPDTHVIKAVVTSDQARVPVTKEESTMVYADR